MNTTAAGDARTLVAPHVFAEADGSRERFLAAQPFRHCAIDNFLNPEFADTLLAQFPVFERGNFLNEDGIAGGKSTVESLHALGAAWRALDACIQSAAFLDLIGRITGIPDLLYDPDYFGGGTHENRHGQGLDSHIDFNYHPNTGWHRRLNLIVYLNHEWRDDWGGSLELHRDPYDPEVDDVVRITPAFNRCVIFETTEHSWHGFPTITLPPDKTALTRKSVALYFYTRERPAAETASRHSTVYVDRPLPAHLQQPGRVLSERDVADLHDLLSRRDGHNRRLYAEIRQLQAKLDLTFAGRLFTAARQLLARTRR